MNTVVANGITTAIGTPFLRETYAPTLRYRIALESGDLEKARRLEPAVLAAPGLSKTGVIVSNMTRSVTLLTRSWICFLFGLYQAV